MMKLLRGFLKKKGMSGRIRRSSKASLANLPSTSEYFSLEVMDVSFLLFDHRTSRHLHIILAMFDLAVDPTSHALIREFYESNKLVSAVCHGPAALVNVKLSDGTYMVQGQTVTGFSNAEEDAYKFTDAMPFLLEDKLKEHGGQYEKADQLFGVKVVTSGKSKNLITGQNPPSAGVIGKVLLQAIQKGMV